MSDFKENKFEVFLIIEVKPVKGYFFQTMGTGSFSSTLSTEKEEV